MTHCEILETTIEQILIPTDLQKIIPGDSKPETHLRIAYLNAIPKTKIKSLCFCTDDQILEKRGFTKDNLQLVPISELLKVINKKFNLDPPLGRFMDPELFGYVEMDTQGRGMYVKKS